MLFFALFAFFAVQKNGWRTLRLESCILDLGPCIWMGGRNSALRLREDQFHRSIDFLFGGESTDREPDRGAGQLLLNTHRL